MHTKPPARPDTVSIHADRDLNDSKSVAPLIWQTSTYSADSAEEFLDIATRPMHDRFYSRYGNPTLSQAQAVIAALEKTETAMLTSSGMAAMSTAVLALVKSGDHVVGQINHYSGTTSLLRKILPRFGVETTVVDQTDSGAFERALRANTNLVVIESPTNPLLQITDIRAVVAMCRARGILTIIDNTFASPINQRPAELGVDVVMHSATKFLGGHSDLVAGALAGPPTLIEKIWDMQIVLGGSLDPFAGWLLLRGLRTLPMRVERHNANATALASFLENHPAISRVYYPGLASHPQHELAASQMSGFGGVLSFELKGGFEAAERFISKLQLAKRAASLGGCESLAVHPAAMWAHSMTEEELNAAGIAPGLIRFSTGLEGTEDLITDFGESLS